MFHLSTQCGLYKVRKRQRVKSDWYFMCCYCLLPHTAAWGYIIYPVQCPMCRTPFIHDCKSLHYSMAAGVMPYLSDQYTLSMVLTDRKQNKPLSIYSQLLFGLVPSSISTPLLRLCSTKVGQSWLHNNGNFKSDIENCAGKGTWIGTNWMAAIAPVGTFECLHR